MYDLRSKSLTENVSFGYRVGEKNLKIFSNYYVIFLFLYKIVRAIKNSTHFFTSLIYI